MENKLHVEVGNKWKFIRWWKMTVRKRYAYWCDSGMTVIVITNCFFG